MESSCLELALEGERQCKVGDYRAGVSFFESAIQVGTEDLQILSAIYSQLGNAYFHLQEYSKALEYHRHDLTLTRTIGDELGEAKASGNLGNTLKLLGRFDEAVVCCQRHLDITRAMYDKVGQARALYNFGNLYHAKGKSICWIGADPGDFPEEARIALKKATQYYEANLSLVKELGDQAAQGRTYGNLGNTYYLLGDFENAVAAHEKCLLIAKEFGDKSAERRAHCNLGNAHIFLGQFDMAAGHYKRTLQLARLLKDRAVEAQACYSHGNTYTFVRDYERAIDYHLKHLVIAQDLKDRVGEGRACWSLGNAHTALGNHEQAMHFAEKHLEIAKETGDKSGEVTARLNLWDLRLVVGLKSNSNIHFNSYCNTNTNSSVLPVSHQGYHSLPADVEAKCLELLNPPTQVTPIRRLVEEGAPAGLVTVKGHISSMEAVRPQTGDGATFPVRNLTLSENGAEVRVALWREANLAPLLVGMEVSISHLKGKSTKAYGIVLNSTAYTSVEHTERADEVVEVLGTMELDSGDQELLLGDLSVLVIPKAVWEADFPTLPAFPFKAQVEFSDESNPEADARVELKQKALVSKRRPTSISGLPPPICLDLFGTL
ncbi:uncharacterized protein ACN63O_019521 [Diretmus argenteus]